MEINKTVIVASRWFLYYLTYIDDVVILRQVLSWREQGQIEAYFTRCTYVILALKVLMCKASKRRKGQALVGRAHALLLLETVNQSWL